MQDDDAPRRKIFQNKKMPLDNQDFSNADVEENHFIFWGGAIPKLDNAKFVGNTIEFVGPAMNTLMLFRMLMQQSERSEREQTLKAWGFMKQDERLEGGDG